VQAAETDRPLTLSRALLSTRARLEAGRPMHKLCGQVNAFNRTGYGEVSNLEDKSTSCAAKRCDHCPAWCSTAPRTMPDVEIDSRLAKKISSVRRDYCHHQGKLEDSSAADGASRLDANAHCTTLHMSSSLPPAFCELENDDRAAYNSQVDVCVCIGGRYR
jgi:hypothetical protein